jgi:hypothetical protein
MLTLALVSAIVWIKVTEPMDTWIWSQVDDITFVDQACKSDNTLPRVCLYRHLSKCRIIFTGSKEKMPRSVELELVRMCQGWFPEPVLLRRKFSDPNYYPNQAAPSVDPVWKYQNGEK